MKLDLTEPQFQELHTVVTEITDRHIEKIVKRMWLSIVALGVMLVLQGFYISYISGTKVQELSQDTEVVGELQNARMLDEEQLAAIRATLVQINVQLNRIENNTKP